MGTEYPAGWFRLPFKKNKQKKQMKMQIAMNTPIIT